MSINIQDAIGEVQNEIETLASEIAKELISKDKPATHLSLHKILEEINGD